MKCFYHDDMDGKCSGAIVNKFFKENPINIWSHIPNNEERTFLRINYKDDFPFDKIVPDELIIIVDFSLQKEGEFKRLLAITENIVWIDHHKSAIEKHENLLFLQGIRQDGIAACELTWEYFYPNTPIPRVVSLLGDYDIWAFKFGEDTNRLQTGIRLYDTHPTSESWKHWLNPHYIPATELKDGEISLRYRNDYYRSLIKSWGFFTEFEGYKAIACNAGSVSSQLFDTVSEDYDLMLPFCFDGRQWTVSIYTKKDIDCSEIAKKYGGGGHKQAAGFQCKELPFHKS